MTAHISAKKEDIAKIVLLAGDPLRARHIAESMLEGIKLVSSTRNAYYYTGNYKNVPVTVGASGMGCPSIGIYSFELYKFYDVECIIRIGTAGAYADDINIYDVVNANKAYSESTYAREAFGFDENHFLHQGIAYDAINNSAAEMNINIHDSNIHSSDVFYRQATGTPKIAAENKCICVEMEAFALFANAQYLKKMAATLLTISDIIPTGKYMSADQRQTSLDGMTKLALESVVEINKRIS